MKRKRRVYFVDIRERASREKIINELLSVEGVSLAKYDNKHLNPKKEEMIKSIFPITVDFETRRIDYLRSVTKAACAVGNKERFMEAVEAIKRFEFRD